MSDEWKGASPPFKWWRGQSLGEAGRSAAAMWMLAGALTLSACTGDTGGADGGADGDGPGVANNVPDAPPNNAPDNPTDPEADPGRVTLHRLNRAEYNATVRDLTGTSLRPADDFPSDDHGYGFDNIADVLSISPVQLELYDRAAELLVEEALLVNNVEARLDHFEAEEVGSMVGGAAGDYWNIWSNGEVTAAFEASHDADYRLAAAAVGQQAGPELPIMVFLIDGLEVARFDVEAQRPDPGLYEVVVPVTAGGHTFSVGFVNDFYDPDQGLDRNLLVDWFEVEGPLGLEGGPNPIRERLVTCDAQTDGVDACGREILTRFATRAWRRPVTDAELDRLMALVQLPIGEGDPFDVGLGLAMQAVLLSPHFIYRVELDPDPNSLTPHSLNDYELASRMSYFIWSSMPDELLFEAASQGRLQDPGELQAQVTRMLADPKAQALVDNFAGQWLYTAALNDVQPDYAIFPDYDDELRDAMRGETQRFFQEFLHGDMSAWEMFTADFTYLNDRLAAHYGIPAPGSGQEMVRVELSDPQRGGLLTHGSVLTVTSYPTRTSPVIRGKWILTQLLCSEPPPPPPGVEGLVEEEIPTGTLRERLEQHRADPVCASCHNLMDPLGFGLESYDGIGAWRDEDVGGFAIDDGGVLDDGTAFEGAAQLSEILAADERFVDCLSEKMFTYALGRGPAFHDRDDLEEIRTALRSDEGRMRSLVQAIVQSHAFRYRRGEPDDGTDNDTSDGNEQEAP